MSMLQQDLFLITLEAQFRDLFQASKAGKDNSEQRLRAQGFIHAGELLQLCKPPTSTATNGKGTPGSIRDQHCRAQTLSPSAPPAGFATGRLCLF